MNYKDIKKCRSNQVELEIAIKNHERLIWYIIHSFKPNSFISNGIEKTDFYQVAIIGFIKAIKSFKQDKKAKFYTYATTIIKNEIRTFLMRKSHTIRIADGDYRVIKTIKSHQSSGLTDIEICKKMNLSLNEYNKITQCSTTLSSLEEHTDDIVEHDDYVEVEMQLLIYSLCDTEKERKVITMKYEGYSKKEISELLFIPYKEITTIFDSFKERLLKEKESL